MKDDVTIRFAIDPARYDLIRKEAEKDGMALHHWLRFHFYQLFPVSGQPKKTADKQ